MGIQLSNHKIFTPCSVVLDSTINGKSSNANTADLHHANTLDILGTDETPSTSLGRKVKLLLTEESLPDLKWQELYQCNEKSCKPVQLAKDGREPILERHPPEGLLT